MEKVVTFGEIMLRLSTPGHIRIIQAESFNSAYSGGEANVAVSLAHFGLRPVFVTRVPDNSIGQAAINTLRRYGVDTTYVVRGGDRLGIYFLETGASQRPSLVIYDRADSAIAEAAAGDFNWDSIFKGAAWFHFTGITPALSDAAAVATVEACCAAKKAGATVSCDLNYRKKLWSRDKAREVMTELMPYVSVIIANEEDAENVFGIKAEAADITKGTLDRDSYREVASRLQETFNFDYVAITLRESYSASDNGWSGMLYDGNESYFSRDYKIHIVDRVGGGDSFAAGIIYGFLQSWNAQETVEFAAAASCLKHSIHGDFNMVSVDEIKKLADGDASGRVQR